MAPLPHPARRGPPWLVVTPRLDLVGRVMRVAVSAVIGLAHPGPDWSGHPAPPRLVRPPNDFGGAHSVSGKSERMVASLPHVVRGEVKGRRKAPRACLPLAGGASGFRARS